VELIGSLVALGVLLALVALGALFSGAAASVGLVGRGRAHRLAEANEKGSRDLVAVMERPGRLLAAASLVRAGSYALATATVAWALESTYADLPLWGALAGAFAVAVVVLFVFAEALPRTVALSNPERVALVAAGPARRLSSLVYPFARALSIVWTWGMGLAAGRTGPGAPWVTGEEYEILFSEDTEDSGPDEAAEALMDAVTHFAERIVREVMVPRTDMACLEDTATAREALELIETAGYSRLPVYHESLDDIRGVLYAKDLLLKLGDRPDLEMRVDRFIRPAYFVPETKPVQELLVEMRRTSHIALVADEYGGTAGLVTIEDLLEEIVGDIFDEYDPQIPMIVELGQGRFRVDARLAVSDLNEAFATVIEREADSVGGLFIEEAGHIPETGESVDVDGLRLIVEELEGNRIRQLVVESTGLNGREEGHHD
jgi:CBS domain containing-hemolysin-like protein